MATSSRCRRPWPAWLPSASSGSRWTAATRRPRDGCSSGRHLATACRTGVADVAETWRAWGGALYRGGMIVAIFAAWEAAKAIPLADPSLFPRPSQILGESVAMAMSGALFENGLQSVARILSGWTSAAALGIPIGLAMGSWRLAEETIGTVIHFLRPVSPVAWIPLAILLFGFGVGGPMFIV